MRKTAVNVCRMLLAATLIFSGFVKAVDPTGTAYKLNDYLGAMHLMQWVPDCLTTIAAVLLAGAEFCLGLFLLFAIQRRLVTRLVLLMMVVMTGLTLWLATANPISDCGCFGDAVTLTNWQTFWKNVILLAAAAVVAWKPTDMFRFVSESNQWIVVNYSVLFILGVSCWSLYYLPQLDFRPYRMGTNLLDNWQRTMEGEDLPYADFFIDSEEGDITEEVLAQKGYSFLLVSPHLEQADDARLDLINELYEYAQEQGYPFRCLTASSEKGMNRWRDITGAEYPICQTDETVLKTIIRSNPGLLLLKDGVVMQKWSHNDLPEIPQDMTTKPLEQMEIGQQGATSVSARVLELVLWFVIPLALLTIADRLWMWTRWLHRRPRKKAEEPAPEVKEEEDNQNP